MCFHIDNNCTTALIAEKNIECYKTLIADGDDFISVYKNYRYKLGKTYSLSPKMSTRFKKILKKSDRINRGYHSYMYSHIAQANTLWEPSKRIIVKCIIPEGSLYFYNRRDSEYVSTQIQIIGKV